jgi:parvulin-like peptidyl-prolyl isomerase
MDVTSSEVGQRRARALLAGGAALGLALAAWSLLSASTGAALPAGAVARVNDALIRQEDYERLLAALASDRRAPLGDADRRFVLDRLIDEELLVQHALALGLARNDRRVRADLVQGVLGLVEASADGSEPTPQELAAFYAENAGYFARPARVRVREVFVATPPGGSDAAALARAREAAARLRAGEDIASVRAVLGDEPVAPVPDALLPPAKLREYVGPTAADAAARLRPGEVSEPVRTPQGYHVLLLASRDEGEAPPLAEVEDEVRAEFKRRGADRILRERLDELRHEAHIAVAPSLP